MSDPGTDGTRGTRDGTGITGGAGGSPHPADSPSMRAAVFRSTGADPAWIGHWLERRRRRTGRPRGEIAAGLGLDERGLAMLALCRSPSEDRFAADLEVVCRHTGAGRDALARLLREERALAAWAPAAAPPAARTGDDRGWLMAACEADADDGPDDDEVNDDGPDADDGDGREGEP